MDNITIPPALYIELLRAARNGLQKRITDHIRADHDPLINIKIDRETVIMLRTLINSESLLHAWTLSELARDVK